MVLSAKDIYLKMPINISQYTCKRLAKLWNNEPRILNGISGNVLK